MKRRIFPGVLGTLLMLLIPYLSVIFFNGMETALLNRRFNAEMFLPAVLAAQISDKYEAETIKAQAVIARSNFYRHIGNRESICEILGEVSRKFHPTYYIFHIPSPEYEEAVTKTEGEVLTWQNKLRLLPYHEISAGATRDGEEVLRSEAYCYLKSVDSNDDKDASDYLNSSYIEEKQMPKELKIVKRDSAGYVTELSADGKILEGEAFRQGLGLSSSNFTIQKVGDKMRFLCKGRGHGLGFSQYGGNMLVKGGSTYKEILKVYFPEMEIADISSL